MEENKNIITFKGNPLTLVGPQIDVGQAAPDVELLDNGLAPVKISSFKGKKLVIVTVPSLDTPVCDIEVRNFNKSAAELADDVQIIAVSMDLPFAQARWCGAAEIEKVSTLSDHKAAEFGLAYGLLIKELRLLARTVFILDTKGTIRYKQLVKEVTDEPDYKQVLDALKEID